MVFESYVYIFGCFLALYNWWIFNNIVTRCSNTDLDIIIEVVVCTPAGNKNNSNSNYSFLVNGLQDCQSFEMSFSFLVGVFEENPDSYSG